MILNAAGVPFSDPKSAEDIDVIRRDGIAEMKGLFSREWTQRLSEDMRIAFLKAHNGGTAVSRGPMRWYVELHPEAISGFKDIITNTALNERVEGVLGPDWKFVEIGMDVPFAGALNQIWHRDFQSPKETFEDHELTSLKANFTGADVEENTGTIRYVPGSQYDDGRAWKDELFPGPEECAAYEARATCVRPKMGDVLLSTALTMHHGTAHNSWIPRPMLVVAYDKPGAGHDKLHDLMMTEEYHASLPEAVREHMICRVVKELEVIKQKHQLNGLKMK